ncbi:MAG: HTH domain-containing protein, partial [Candidatus Zixiibacteriota bacterium]
MEFVMGKADRLLLILNLIRSRRNLRAKDLALECGVSERTIFRDINAISSANIPIYFENGYKFLTDAFLPPLNFSLDEYLVLYLGL